MTDNVIHKLSLQHKVVEHLRSNRAEAFDSSILNEDALTHSFWINDLLFLVPPEQISIDQDMSVFQWKSLRTNTTSKIPSGQSSTYIRVQTTLPSSRGIINVNYCPGREYRTGLRGGLIDLILEFKNTPFCYIENAFIRSRLGLDENYSMAAVLHQINVGTISGFPGTLNVDLLLGLFNYKPYAPKFGYKDHWDPKSVYTDLTFPDINPTPVFDKYGPASLEQRFIDTTGSIVQQSLGPSSFMSTDLGEEIMNSAELELARQSREAEGEFITEAAPSRRPSEEEIPLRDTFGFEDLKDQDSQFMSRPSYIGAPAFSEVYTHYMDWLRERWDLRGFSEMQPIGASDHNIGDKVIFSWREYRRFAIPQEVFRSLKNSVKSIVGNADVTVAGLGAGSGSLNTEVSPISLDTALDLDDVAQSAPRPVEIDVDNTRFSTDFASWIDENRFYIYQSSGYNIASNLVDDINSPDRRDLWPNMVNTLLMLSYIQELAGVDLRVTTALSGHSGNHSVFRALDFRAGSPEDALRLHRVMVAVAESSSLMRAFHMGLGFYLGPSGDASRGDFDHGNWPGTGIDQGLGSITEEIAAVAPIRTQMQHIDTFVPGTDGSEYKRSRGLAFIYQSRLRDSDGYNQDEQSFSNDAREMVFLRIKNAYANALGSFDIPDIEADEVFVENQNAVETVEKEKDSISIRSEGPDDDAGQSEDAILAEILRMDIPYREWVNSIVSKGYSFYNGNSSILDVFYKVRTLEVSANNTGHHYDILTRGSKPVCTSINAGLVNLFKEIPLNGHYVPTAQFLGGMDTTYNMGIICNGLGQVQQISEMCHRLKHQAVTMRQVPDSWIVKIENPLVNAFGHRHAAITNEKVDTIPGSPGAYHFTLNLLGHRPYEGPGESFDFQGANDPEKVMSAFFQDLFFEGYLSSRSIATREAGRQGLFPAILADASRIRDLTYGHGFALSGREEFVADSNYFYDFMNILGAAQPVVGSGWRPQIGASPFSRSWRAPYERGSVNINLPVELQEELTPSFGEDDKGFSKFRGVLEDLAIVIDNINSCLIDSAGLPAGSTIDISRLDFLGIGPSVLGDLSPIQRTMSRYNEFYALSRFAIVEMGSSNFSQWSGGLVGSSLTNLDDIVEDIGVANAEQWLSLGAMPYLEQGSSMVDSDTPGFRPNNLIDPVVYSNREANHEWREAPYIWQFSRAAHESMITANYFLDATQNPSGGSDFNNSIRSTPTYIYALIDAIDSMRANTSNAFESAFSENLPLNVYSTQTGFNELLNRLYGPPPSGGDFNLVNVNGREYSFPRFLIESELSTSNNVSLTMPQNSIIDAFTRTNINSGAGGADGQRLRLMVDAIPTINAWAGPEFFIDEGNDRDSKLASLISNLETYLYYSVFLPSLAASVSFSELVNHWAIVRRADGSFVFPRLAQEVNVQKIIAGGLGYPDLTLPEHPYWNNVLADQRLIDKPVFTQPDFYFYNWGFDSDIEAVEDPRGMSSVNVQGPASTIIYEMTGRNPAKGTPLMINRLNATDASPTSDIRMWASSFGINRWFNSDDHTAKMHLATEDSDGAPASHGPGRNAAEITAAMENATGIANPKQSKIDLGLLENDVDLTNARDENQRGLAINREVRQSGTSLVDDSQPALTGAHLSWNQMLAGFGRYALSTATPFPTLDRYRYSMDPDDLEEMVIASTEAMDDATSNLDMDEWQRQRGVVEELTGLTIPMPSPGAQGNWDGSRYFEDNSAASIDYSFTPEALHHLAYEGMKDLDRRKYCMRRAFPTYKVMFVEWDSLENKWKSLDDFYSYSQIRSIRVVRSRKVPADLCTIEFINVSGLLTGNDKLTKTGARVGLEVEAADETLNPDLVDTFAEQGIAGFALQEGTSIVVKLGYSNNHKQMEDVFMGSVVSVSYSENADILTCIAQSYATELVAKQKGRNPADLGDSYPNTFQLLASMMFEPEVIHFGRCILNRKPWAGEDQSIKVNEYVWSTDSSNFGSDFLRIAGAILMPAQEAFRQTVGRVAGFIGDAFSGLYRSIFTNTSVTPMDGPQDDNIYVPDERDIVDNGLFDGDLIPFLTDFTNVITWGNFGVDRYRQGVERNSIDADDYEYTPLSTTIWDIFQEMTLRHPGWIASAVPYSGSARMTMFFGLPSQRYWYRSAEDIPWSGDSIDNLLDKAFNPIGQVIDQGAARIYFDLVAQRFRPFRQYHVLTSQTDIVMNNMIATTHGTYNTVSIQHRKIPTGNSEHDRRSRQIALQYAQNDPDDDDVVTVKLNTDIKDSDVREAFVRYFNCRSEPLAYRYALSALAKYVKDMYKGSIVVLGNPRLKPYDLCYINDTYNDVCGPIEVEEVVHTFSHETGFITEIVPDAFAVSNDIGSWWSYFSHKYFVSNKFGTFIGHGPSIVPQVGEVKEIHDRSDGTPTTTSEILHSVHNSNIFPEEATRAIRSYNQSPASLINVFTSILGLTSDEDGGGGISALSEGNPVASMALSVGKYMLGDYVYYSWARFQNNTFIFPLIRYGSPWTAGIPWTANTAWASILGGPLQRWFESISDRWEDWTSVDSSAMEEWEYANAAYREAVIDRINQEPGFLQDFAIDFRNPQN